MARLLPILILLPLFGSILNGLLLRSPYVRRTGVIATFFAGASFCSALLLYFQVLKTGQPILFSMEWFRAGSLRIDWGLSFDALTATMSLVVTGIGTLIHLYSIGYLAEDATPSRYFAYLNLFLFNMLLLLCGDNLPVLFVGWEGVGLCSYLLIGYWYKDLKNCNAGTKAFIVNRIGDAGFLLGIFLCSRLFHSVRFSDMAHVIGTTSPDLRLMNIAGILLFIGAMGKSAQIPLYVWLPDAMAGPTPVSALIHAATMVTAGIYLVVRMSFLFQVAAEANHLIVTIGAATALMAALIGTSQRDIKKVLAYSTISQLGLIFVALGVGAYTAGIFHVVTHAFFKALLFLGAGSVIHAMDGEQDIFKMGGLRAHLPITFVTFCIGVVAISGIPPFAGFFSKDLILYSALAHSGWMLWATSLLVSFLTAFYMGRLFALVFLSSGRGPERAHAPHESPWVMLLPLIILAVGSTVAGFIPLPNFLSTLLPSPDSEMAPLTETAAMGVATGIGLMGLCLGLYFYRVPKRAEKVATVLMPLRVIFENKFWVDELYSLLLVQPFEVISRFLARFFDVYIVDGGILLSGRLCRAGGFCLSLVQTGSVQLYLFVMVIGSLCLVWRLLSGGTL